LAAANRGQRYLGVAGLLACAAILHLSICAWGQIEHVNDSVLVVFDKPLDSMKLGTMYFPSRPGFGIYRRSESPDRTGAILLGLVAPVAMIVGAGMLVAGEWTESKRREPPQGPSE
jgi:hypothetical protein